MIPPDHLAAFIIVALLGLVMGSFLNVCIWRVPRGESIVMPGSRCPGCGTPILARDNVPIASYLLLRGRCRACGVRVSARYPLVEGLNAVFYLADYARFGPGWHLPVHFVFLSSLLVITFIDLDHQIIPDRITLPGMGLGLLAGAFLAPDPFARQQLLGPMGAAVGGLSGFGFFYAVAVLSRGGMGGGDVKMMGMAGTLLGWKGVFLTTLLGSLAGSAVGLYLIAFKGGGRKTRVPFGPFLALGSAVSLLAGQEVLRLYMDVYAGR